MKKEYIPVLVQRGDKQEIWKMDITYLSVTDLIQLKQTLSDTPFNRTIQSLDSIIKRDIETIVPSHNVNSGSYVRIHKKKKKEEKLRRKIKNRKIDYDKYKR